jgi:hypothetical protein
MKTNLQDSGDPSLHSGFRLAAQTPRKRLNLSITNLLLYRATSACAKYQSILRESGKAVKASRETAPSWKVCPTDQLKRVLPFRFQISLLSEVAKGVRHRAPGTKMTEKGVRV